MRRIVDAVRSLGDRLPLLLRLVPDLMLVAGYLGLGYWLSLYDSRLAVGWLAIVPFIVGLAIEADAYLRGRTTR